MIVVELDRGDGADLVVDFRLVVIVPHELVRWNAQTDPQNAEKINIAMKAQINQKILD